MNECWTQALSTGTISDDSKAVSTGKARLCNVVLKACSHCSRKLEPHHLNRRHIVRYSHSARNARRTHNTENAQTISSGDLSRMRANQSIAFVAGRSHGCAAQLMFQVATVGALPFWRQVLAHSQAPAVQTLCYHITLWPYCRAQHTSRALTLAQCTCQAPLMAILALPGQVSPCRQQEQTSDIAVVSHSVSKHTVECHGA